MRIGLLELCLIILIASIAIGPTVTLWVERWMRRAKKTNAAAARRRAAQQAQFAAEREAVLHRFQVVGLIFAACMVVGLVYTLVLRPIESPPQTYSAPAVRDSAALAAQMGGALPVEGCRSLSCIRQREGWLYFSAQDKSGAGYLLRMREDGSGMGTVLTVAGEITGFDFDAEGSLWLAVLTENGGALCRAGYDGWGAAMEQVVTQMDGRALTALSAVAAGPDGKIYFAQTAEASAPDGLETALRTELMSHTATGSVYVYDPSARTVQQVLGGIAGASGLAFAPDGQTLYVSDLGTRCIWAVSPQSRELTAGGKGCGVFADSLPGYPGALSAAEDGTVYVSYRWAYSGWLEEHADGTLLRGVALRLSGQMQAGMFRLPASAPSAEALDLDGVPRMAFAGRELGSAAAVCPAGSRVYLGSADGSLHWLRI
ncbi:MAG: SMP-30/gluconolactonase/LRE family protein [Faecalibacterium sp.]